MGNELSSQSGGARAIKVIQDEIAAETAKATPDDARIATLRGELDAALARKKELEETIKHPETSADEQATLNAELTALTLGISEENRGGSVDVQKEGVEENTATVSTNTKNIPANIEAIPNTSDELKAKLEKCKERQSEEDETTDIEKTQESIKKDVPGFFSTLFGNWFTYDHWQSTPEEKEAADCKELLEKFGSEGDNNEGNNGGSDGGDDTGNDNGSDGGDDTGNDNGSDGGTEETAPSASPSAPPASPAPSAPPASPTIRGNIATASNATGLPAPNVDSSSAVSLGNLLKAGKGGTATPTDAAPASAAAVGGRRYTHKNRTNRKKTRTAAAAAE